MDNFYLELKGRLYGSCDFFKPNFTGNQAQPWAEALKITGEQITHVGSNDEVKDACTDNTETLDLPGMLITPGLVDAHCHFVSPGRAFQMVNLRQASSHRWQKFDNEFKKLAPPAIRGNG